MVIPRTALALLVCAMLALPAHAAADSWPTLLEVKSFAAQPLTPKTLMAIEKDFANHTEAVLKKGGPKLKKTDTGYGAHYRLRYPIKGGYVEVYSGIFDGSRTDVHVAPIALSEAVKLMMDLQRKEGSGLVIDYSTPAERAKSEVTYRSKGDGCVAAVTFILDAQGRCTSFTKATAC